MAIITFWSKLLVTAFITVSWYRNCNTVTSAALSCYCNFDGPDIPKCVDRNQTSLCEFESTAKRVPREGGGMTTLADDLATCIAINHPVKGVIYACGWGSHVTGRMCSVLVDKDGVKYEMCRCNTKNFCNEDFFEDEMDVSAVETTQLSASEIPTTTPTLAEIVIVGDRQRGLKNNPHQKSPNDLDKNLPKKTALLEVLPSNTTASKQYLTKPVDGEKAPPTGSMPQANQPLEPPPPHQLKPTNDPAANPTANHPADSLVEDSQVAHKEGTNNGDPVDHSNLVVVPENHPAISAESSTLKTPPSQANKDDSKKPVGSGGALTTGGGVNVIILKLVALTIVFVLAAIPSVTL